MTDEPRLNKAGFFISCASSEEPSHEKEEKGRQVLTHRRGFTDSRRLPRDVDFTDDKPRMRPHPLGG